MAHQEDYRRQNNLGGRNPDYPETYDMQYGQPSRDEYDYPRSYGPRDMNHPGSYTGTGYGGAGFRGGYGTRHYEGIAGGGYMGGSSRGGGFGNSYGASGSSGIYGGGLIDHSGRGPRNYRRSDDRIWEDVNDELTRHPGIDASDIEVRVREGEVTLSGTVDDRGTKRMAEDIADSCSGVRDVHNELHVQRVEQGQKGRSVTDREVPRHTENEPGPSAQTSKERGDSHRSRTKSGSKNRSANS